MRLHSPTSTGRRALALRRLAAFSIDWLVIALWGGLVFLAVYMYSGGMPQRFSGPWVAQGVGILVMTLPVFLYFAFLESSEFGGSYGKRLMRLRVKTVEGTPLHLKDSFVRTAIKFAPWELGHLVAQQSFYAEAGATPTWLYLPMALSIAIPLWWFLGLFRRAQNPYDVLAGAIVEDVPDPLVPQTN